MLSVDTIARVILNVVRSAAQPTSWDTGLLLVKTGSSQALHMIPQQGKNDNPLSP